MSTASQRHSHKFAPLLSVFKRVQWLLENSRSQQIIIAAMTMEDFQKQALPAHCTVRQRKIKGPRVPTKHRAQHMTWPNDGLTENNYPTWHIIIKGKADIRIMDYVVHCHPGDVVFTPANVPRIDSSRPHYEKITPDAFCDILTISLSLNGVSVSVCHSHGDSHDNGIAGEASGLKHPLAISLGHELATELQSSGSDKSTFNLFLGLLLFIQHKIEQGEGIASWQFPVIPTATLQRDPISQALEYMKNHFYSPLTIDKVARWVGISRTVFIRQFRRQTGTTFRVHLTKLRMDAAENYLLHSNISVEHVSTSVGLTSNHLRNLFYRYHQCSPTEFRLLKRKVQD